MLCAVVGGRCAVRSYGARDVVTHWQVDNELGHEGSDVDFSPLALAAWRTWLPKVYGGDVGALNAAWGTVFWGATCVAACTQHMPAGD